MVQWAGCRRTGQPPAWPNLVSTPNPNDPPYRFDVKPALKPCFCGVTFSACMVRDGWCAHAVLTGREARERESQYNFQYVACHMSQTLGDIVGLGASELFVQHTHEREFERHARRRLGDCRGAGDTPQEDVCFESFDILLAPELHPRFQTLQRAHYRRVSVGRQRYPRALRVRNVAPRVLHRLHVSFRYTTLASDTYDAHMTVAPEEVPNAYADAALFTTDAFRLSFRADVARATYARALSGDIALFDVFDVFVADVPVGEAFEASPVVTDALDCGHRCVRIGFRST